MRRPSGIVAHLRRRPLNRMRRERLLDCFCGSLDSVWIIALSSNRLKTYSRLENLLRDNEIDGKCCGHLKENGRKVKNQRIVNHERTYYEDLSLSYY